MTMNGLPDVNIQGVPQYWTHFFFAFLSVEEVAEVGGVLKNSGNLHFCIFAFFAF